MSLGDPDILDHTLLPVITSPNTGSSVSGTASVSVAVTVPAGAAVASVYLQKLGGGQIGTASGSGTTFSGTIDTTQLANGWNGVVAVAVDSQGNTYVSPSIEVSASNP